MARSGGAPGRGIWRTIHLWIGLSLFIVLAPLGLTGSLLVWGDGLDKLVHPARYEAGAGVLAPQVYLDAATRAFAGKAVASQLKMPTAPGAAVMVAGASTAKARPGQRPPFLTAWIDPATGRVIDTGDRGRELVGIVHRIHGNMMLPQNGRPLVGWLGVAMLVSSLTGLTLWWPRNNAVLRGMRWGRSASVFSNLHHLVGFWVCVPLAALSLSGAYIAFPPAMHALTAPLQPSNGGADHNGGRGSDRGQGAPLAKPAMSVDQAIAAAEQADGGLGGARLVAVTLPSATGKPAWRVQLKPGAGDAVTVKVDDASGKARIQADQGGEDQGGDPIARFMRRLHDGSGYGPIWRAVMIVTGVAPTLLGLTGAVIWFSRRETAAKT